MEVAVRNLKTDPNILAYQRDVKAGKFKSFKIGTWIAYCEGKLIIKDTRKKRFFTRTDKAGKSCYVVQLGTEEIVDLTPVTEVAKVRSPKAEIIGE